MRSQPPPPLSIEEFGCLTFHKGIMEKTLSKEVFFNLVAVMEGKEKVNPLYADSIAEAMRIWAVNLGATHFCHWFHPLTGRAAEKHDAFLDVGAKGQIIEKFSGKWLFKGEPDGSSFPTGGLRKTAKARGYSSWDCLSLPFIWKSGDVITLCVPAVFFSWNGDSLDMKMPLMRSEEKLEKAVLRLLNQLDVDISKVYPTLGCEQEYFLIPKDLVTSRPDLLLNGRTLFGAPSIKGQQLDDHYFSIIPEKVICFMQDVEERAFQLGIPLKTRHCEVAPQQYEVAPLFGRAFLAVDHNILLMQIMEQVAAQHDLFCLFHEKPFSGINGSGKHCNWSLSTDTGINLLDPGLLESNPLLFLSSITVVISAVYRHSDLLRASIASAANDHRLGGNEAPLALISIYLGEELENLLEAVESKKEFVYKTELARDLQLPSLPPLLLDATDRNRTSPFVFTGNKFEFRSVGASSHPAAAVTVLNAIIAESFNLFVDQIEKERGASLKDSILTVIQRQLAYSRKIRYLGDNYEDSWKKEASLRGLVHLERSAHSFDLFLQEKADSVFEGILSKKERASRVVVLQSTYSHTIESEAEFMIELFDTQILPACLDYQKDLAKNIYWVDQSVGGLTSHSKVILTSLSEGIQRSIIESKKLKSELFAASSLDLSSRTLALSDLVMPQMSLLRKEVDALEVMVQDVLWPLAKYREILFSL